MSKLSDEYDHQLEVLRGWLTEAQDQRDAMTDQRELFQKQFKSAADDWGKVVIERDEAQGKIAGLRKALSDTLGSLHVIQDRASVMRRYWEKGATWDQEGKGI